MRVPSTISRLKKRLFVVPSGMRDYVKIKDNTIELTYNGKKVFSKFKEWETKQLQLGMLYENIVQVQYKELNVKDRIVIDIGACMGDTAFFFLLQGAKKVYAYETDSKYFKLLEENIALNGFGDKIKAFMTPGIISNA